MITVFCLFERKWQQQCRTFLALFWIAGLLFGASASVSGRQTILLLMHRHLFQPMSIVGLLRCSFSFLITVLAVLLSKPSLFLSAAFVKSFLFAFVLEAAVRYWPVAGGIVILPFFACSLFSVCNILWFWFRHISGFDPTVIRDIFLCFLFHCIMGYAEMCFWGNVFA